jgi:hypothetical protein
MLGLKISGLYFNIADNVVNQLYGSIKACVDALTVTVFEADVLAFAWTDLDGFGSHLFLLGFKDRDECSKHLSATTHYGGHFIGTSAALAVGTAIAAAFAGNLLGLHLGHGLVVCVW